jgi:hypothetical protein
VPSLADDPGRWAALRTAGLDAAAARTWDAVASEQAQLYAGAITRGTASRKLRPRRAHAQARYGDPAQPAGGGRPFAVPLLRNDNPVTRGLARATDAVSGVLTGFGARRD